MCLVILQLKSTSSTCYQQPQASSHWPTSHAQAPTHHGAANPQQQQPELSFQQLQQYLADVVSKIMDENKKKV
jgi:hypothetical protein